MKKDQITLPQGVTAEMVAAWKEQFGADKVRLAELPLDDNGEKVLEVVVRVPGRKELGEFEKWIDRNPDKAKEIMVNACLLTKKDEVKAQDDLFLAAFDAISQLLPIRKAIIKNL